MKSRKLTLPLAGSLLLTAFAASLGVHSTTAEARKREWCDYPMKLDRFDNDCTEQHGWGYTS